MKEYLKCPACGQTKEFRGDALVTANWSAELGIMSEIGSPQVQLDYYIACMAPDCVEDGTIKDFWVGDPKQLEEPFRDHMFLDDIHEFHKHDIAKGIKEHFASRGWHVEDRDHFCYAFCFDLPDGYTIYMGKNLDEGGSELPTRWSDSVYEELVDPTGASVRTWTYESLDLYIAHPTVSTETAE